MSKKSKQMDEPNPEVQKNLEQMYKNVELDSEKKKEIEQETSKRQEKLVEEIQNTLTIKDYLIRLWEAPEVMHEDQKTVTKNISDINDKIDQELKTLQLKIVNKEGPLKLEGNHVEKEKKDINLVTYNYKMEKFEEMKIKHQLKDAEILKKNLSKKLKSLETDIDVMKSFKEWGHNKNDIHASIDMDEQRREEIEAKIKSIMKERKLISRERKDRIDKMWDDIKEKEIKEKEKKKLEQDELMNQKRSKIQEHIEWFQKRKENKDQDKKEFEDMIKKIGKTPETIKKIEQRYKDEMFKELEEKKKRLAELRQLSQDEHKKIVDDMLKKKQARQDEHERLKQKPKLPKFHSEEYQKQSEGIRQERKIFESQKEKIKEMLKKKEEFFESVKKPEADEKKSEEMQKLIAKSHHKSRKRYNIAGDDEEEQKDQELSYKQLVKKGNEFLKFSQAHIDREKLEKLKEERPVSADQNPKVEKSKEDILKEKKQLVEKYTKKKKNPNDSMISNADGLTEANTKKTDESILEETVSNQDGKEKKPRNYLKELQRERAKKIKEGEIKVQPQVEMWQKIKSSKISESDKKDLMKAEIARMEEHAKMKEMEMKHMKRKFILPEDDITPVDEMYINAIKAKLSLLE